VTPKRVLSEYNEDLILLVFVDRWRIGARILLAHWARYSSYVTVDASLDSLPYTLLTTYKVAKVRIKLHHPGENMCGQTINLTICLRSIC